MLKLKMSELSITFTFGNLLTDTGVIAFAIWVYFHSKKKGECFAERERITYQTIYKKRQLEEHRKSDEEVLKLHIRALEQGKKHMPSDEWEKEWNNLWKRNDEVKENLKNEESKIDWEEANRISELQGKYFRLFRRHKIYFWIIIAVLSIGIVIQLYALCKACDFSQVMSKIYDLLNTTKNLSDRV